MRCRHRSEPSPVSPRQPTSIRSSWRRRVNAPAVEVSNTGTFDSSDAYLKWKGISRLDWAWKHLDVVATVRFIDGFHERYPNGLIHYTSQTWFFDGQLSYDFTFVPPVENQPVAGYSKDARDVTTGKDGKATESAVSQTVSVGLPLWKQVLNGTAITIGCNNIFGTDPPKAYGFGNSSTGYPGFIYDCNRTLRLPQSNEKVLSTPESGNRLLSTPAPVDASRG